mgnify:FL=1
MKISASDITSYKYCPRSYFREKVLKLVRPPNEQQVRGSLVHNIYSYFFANKVYERKDYLEWFVDEGINRFINKENERISKLNLSKTILKDDLFLAVNRVINAFKEGRIQIPREVEKRIENEEFVAISDAIFSDSPDNNGFVLGEVKLGYNLERVKLQLAVATIIYEGLGQSIKGAKVIDAYKWQEIPIEINDSVKEEVYRIRAEILKLWETKEVPECICGRCD